MANEYHVGILKQGVEIWNQWREDHPEKRPDLSEAHLSEAILSGANLNGANLNGAHLSEAYLIGADLCRADLREAHLREAGLSQAHLIGADLGEADLYDADFSEADLRDADLRLADLSLAHLGLADFSNAEIGWTVFGSVDLSDVKGLDTVRHDGPSYIDIQTVYRSNGNIPEKFMRGAGVPDTFITFMKSLTNAAIDFYSCFISYSTKDQAFAERLYADLQAKGVRCWYAPEDIQGGKKIHEQIEQAIRLYDKLLLVLSDYSMNSEWVKTEVYKARQQELKEQRRKLFPISLVEYDTVRQWQAFDADIGKDMAREVREYFIPDFTQWKEHDAYQKAFERLLRDLKTQ